MRLRQSENTNAPEEVEIPADVTAAAVSLARILRVCP